MHPHGAASALRFCRGADFMDFDFAAAVAIAALTTCFFLWLGWARYAPIHLAVSDETWSPGAEPQGDVPDRAGKVGELVTALMHAKDGWQQLRRGQSEGGLDGVFVRKIGGRLFEVRIVESMCSRDGDPKSTYKAEQLADERVIEQLQLLKDAKFEGEPYMEPQAIDSIIKAIRRGSKYVTKHFYAHMLGSGSTLIYSVRRDGELVDSRARVKRVSGAPHRYMLQALAIGLAQADTGGGVADAAMSASSGD